MMKPQARNWQHRLEKELDRLNGKFHETRGAKAKLQPLPNDAERKLILEFVSQCKADRLSPPRMENYVKLLRLTKRHLPKQLDQVTKKDMVEFMDKIESSDLSEWSKQGYRICMKKFYHWVAVEKWGQKLKKAEYPEAVEWISTTIKNDKKKLPEGILNEDDIKKLLEYCKNIRDKALVMTLWDSGCRIGELLSLQLKSITFDNQGAMITVNGKTGSRRVRLVPSVPYLANWTQNHPNKDNPESALFVCNGTKRNGRNLTYSGVDAFLRDLKQRSGIKKGINAHSFRHARATFFATRVRESVSKEIFGWTQRSQMPAIYTHLSGDKVDKEVLKAQGIIVDPQPESKLVPVKCYRCQKQNEATAQYCNQCMMPLNEILAREVYEKEQRAGKIWGKVTAKPNYTINRNTVKEVLKEMIKSGEIKL